MYFTVSGAASGRSRSVMAPASVSIRSADAAAAPPAAAAALIAAGCHPVSGWQYVYRLRYNWPLFPVKTAMKHAILGGEPGTKLTGCTEEQRQQRRVAAARYGTAHGRSRSKPENCSVILAVA
jgi:hypothetical protein